MITTDPLLDQLHPVGLTELVSRAALLTRRDRKYLLPAEELPALLRGIDPGVRVLRIDGRYEFAYESTYFDTSGLECYLATARRRRRRYKVRVRTYVDTGGRFLEVKTRQARGTTAKHRFAFGGTDELDAHAYACVDGVLGRGTGPMEQALVTRYRRITLFVPSTGGRVTIDRELSWTLPDGRGTAIPDRLIVETKSVAAAAGPVDRLLWSLGHRPFALSKYGTGLALLRPDLPANRWHRVLRHHLTDRRPI